jgi:hypothetical protein
MRICLNIAIVEMVVKVHHNSTNNQAQCEAPDSGGSGGETSSGGDFEWDEEFQGIILGAFYWG